MQDHLYMHGCFLLEWSLIPNALSLAKTLRRFYQPGCNRAIITAQISTIPENSCS